MVRNNFFFLKFFLAFVSVCAKSLLLSFVDDPNSALVWIPPRLQHRHRLAICFSSCFRTPQASILLCLFPPSSSVYSVPFSRQPQRNCFRYAIFGFSAHLRPKIRMVPCYDVGCRSFWAPDDLWKSTPNGPVDQKIGFFKSEGGQLLTGRGFALWRTSSQPSDLHPAPPFLQYLLHCVPSSLRPYFRDFFFSLSTSIHKKNFSVC